MGAAPAVSGNPPTASRDSEASPQVGRQAFASTADAPTRPGIDGPSDESSRESTQIDWRRHNDLNIVLQFREQGSRVKQFHGGFFPHAPP